MDAHFYVFQIKQMEEHCIITMALKSEQKITFECIIINVTFFENLPSLMVNSIYLNKCVNGYSVYSIGPNSAEFGDT